MNVLRALATWGRMVKFSHSVFALPFALAGAALAAAEHGMRAAQLGWIAVAMVGARNAAMGFNRLVDQEFDARNPRTASRELPRGSLSRPAVWVFTIALSLLFVLAAFQLGPLCAWLSPVALALVFGYSFTKRFTWASHLVLGLALAAAPVGGWLAIAGRFAALPVVLAAAVVLWVAGFDIVYACQDVAFDRQAGLHSIPARFGVARALAWARSCHVAALLGLVAVGWLGRLHPVYWIGLSAVAAVVLWEHRRLGPAPLPQSTTKFLNRNGLVSLLYLGTVLATLLVPRIA